jgi:hypothetical protein
MHARLLGSLVPKRDEVLLDGLWRLHVACSVFRESLSYTGKITGKIRSGKEVGIPRESEVKRCGAHVAGVSGIGLRHC